MYGVPRDLPLDGFVGKEFNQVGVGKYDLQFIASGTGRIQVEGRWELKASDGSLVDRSEDPETRSSHRIHSILNVTIASFRLSPPTHFELVFENGHVLTVFDADPRYESFSVHLEGGQSWYI